MLKKLFLVISVLQKFVHSDYELVHSDEVLISFLIMKKSLQFFFFFIFEHVLKHGQKLIQSDIS